MKDKVEQEQLPILEKLDLLVKSTNNFPSLVAAAGKEAIISPLENDTIITKFVSEEDQKRAFYLLLNSKAIPLTNIVEMLNSTENASVVSILQQKNEVSEKEEWSRLQPVIASNIDRLSSHTMNLGLVLCFSSGVGLITGKDREIIANSSTLEIDQLKEFYVTVSLKQEDAYGKLLKVLRMTNNNWALDVLHISD